MRRKWSGQDVPSGARSLERVRIDEFQHFGRIREMPDLALVRGNLSPNRGQQPGRGLAARLRRQRGMARAEKSGFPLVRGEPVGRLLDDAQRRLVAALRSRPPGEQAVSAEHHADIFGMIGRHLAELQAEIEAGTLPRQKADLAAENLLRQLFGVGRGGDRDHRVGVDVIDVACGNKGVQRRIDRGRARIEIEGAMVEQRDHFVFMREAAIEPLQATRACRDRGWRSRRASSSRCRRPSP